MLQSSIGSDNCFDTRGDDLFEMTILDFVWPDIIAHGTVGSDFNYDKDVQSFLCSVSKLPWEKVEIIIMALCEREYFYFLKQLVKLIFNKVGVLSRQDFLDPSFIDKIENSIILSKHNKKTKKINAVAYNLVSGMFACNGNGLSSLGAISKSLVKNAVVYILATNMILSMSMPQDGKLGFAA